MTSPAENNRAAPQAAPEKIAAKPVLNEQEQNLLRQYKKDELFLRQQQTRMNMAEENITALRGKTDPESVARLNESREYLGKALAEIAASRKKLEELENNFRSIAGRELKQFSAPQGQNKQNDTSREKEKKGPSQKPANWTLLDAQKALDPHRGHLNRLGGEIAAALPPADTAGRDKISRLFAALAQKFAAAQTPDTQNPLIIEARNYDLLLQELSSVKTDVAKLSQAVAKLDPQGTVAANLEAVRNFLKTGSASPATKPPVKPNSEPKPELLPEGQGFAPRTMLVVGILLKKFPALGDALRNFYLSMTEGGLDTKSMFNGLLVSIFGKKQLRQLKGWLMLTPGEMKQEKAKNNQEAQARREFIRDVAVKNGFDGAVLQILTEKNLLPFLFKRYPKGISATEYEKILGSMADKPHWAALTASFRGKRGAVNKILLALTARLSQNSNNKKRAHFAATGSYALLQSAFHDQVPSPKPKVDKKGKSPSVQTAQPEGSHTEPGPWTAWQRQFEQFQNKKPKLNLVRKNFEQLFGADFSGENYCRYLEKLGVGFSTRGITTNTAGQCTGLYLKGSFAGESGFRFPLAITVQNSDPAKVKSEIAAITPAIIRISELITFGNTMITKLTKMFSNKNDLRLLEAFGAKISDLKVLQKNPHLFKNMIKNMIKELLLSGARNNFSYKQGILTINLGHSKKETTITGPLNGSVTVKVGDEVSLILPWKALAPRSLQI